MKYMIPKNLQKPIHISIKHQNKSATLQIQLLTVFSHPHKNSKDRRVMVSHTFLLIHVSIKSIIRVAIMYN